MLFIFFFFFQAEDGIRDKLVTGVQTCALPILGCRRGQRPPARSRAPLKQPATRSEERRVGKGVDLGGRRIIKKKKKKEKKQKSRDKNNTDQTTNTKNDKMQT